MKEASWTQESFSKQLRMIVESKDPEPLDVAASTETDPTIEGFRQAAAVISSFDPRKIEPYGRVSRHPGDFTVLLDDSEPVAGASAVAWTLRPEVRARTLRRLTREGLLGEVVFGTKASDEDPVHQILRGIVSGKLGDLESRSEAELAAALELAKGVGDDLPGLPPAEELIQVLGRKRLLAPFYHLANPKHFRGRAAELEALRNYVGVADPKTVSGSIFRRVREFFGFEKRPPLMIFGPGGMGKSALLSHFIREHAELDEDRRFPFAYLDFDRPIVTAREPLTLLGEILVQLGTQYPAIAEECEGLRSRLLPNLGWALQATDDEDPEWYALEALESVQVKRGTSSSDFEQEEFIRALAEMFSRVASRNQPFLLVLDTFEEVQHYSRAAIPNLLSFLGLVQRAIPRLRVVLAGRARESSVRIQPLPLGSLEPDDAVEVLTSFGVAKKAAKLVVSTLGGTPLTLRLATDVYLRDGLKARDLDEIAGRKSFLERVTQERIQAELYRRFLKHIKDEQVQKIAHPGLVLRRVTPDLIFKVLRDPCELDIDTPEEARDLFERLGMEDTLVSWEGSAIVHRSDVRRIMIALLKEDKKKQVEAIHRNAVDYYAAFDDPVSRTEEIYHRYCLGQGEEQIEARWLDGVEDRLRNAIDEVPEDLRAHLASRVGAETLDERFWQDASHRDWELYVAARVRQLIGHARYEEALELMDERPRKVWSDASPLFNLEVVTLARLGELDRALELGKEALERVRASGDLEQEVEVDLRASIGSVLRRAGRPSEAVGMLEAGAHVAESQGELLRALDLLLLAQESRDWQASEEAGSCTLETMARWAERAKPRQIVSTPVLFSRVADEIDSSHPKSALRIRGILTAEHRKSRQGAMPTRWSGRQIRKLQDSLPRVVSGTPELEKFLAHSLDLSLREVTKGGSLRSIVFELITYLERNGRLGELVTALRQEYPILEWLDELYAEGSETGQGLK